MSVIGIVCGLVLAGQPGVTVTLTPDQPLPFAYVDEPVILELRAAGPVSTRIGADVTGPGPARTPLDLGNVNMQAGQTRWLTLDGIPREKGWYEVRVSMDGAEHSKPLSLCQIDRPVAGAALPVSVHAPELTPALLYALQTIGVTRLELDGSSEDIVEQAQAARQHGFEIAIRINAAGQDTGPDVFALAQVLEDKVSRWILAGGDDPRRMLEAAQALLRGGSQAPMSLAVTTPDALSENLAAGAGQFVNAIVLPPNRASELRAFRRAAEEAGYEWLAMHAVLTGTTRASALLQRTLLGLSEGSAQATLDSAVVCTETLREPFPHLCALARTLGDARFLGEIDEGDDATVLVFRSNSRWVVALWSASGEQEVVIPVGEPTELTLTDALNNRMPLPEIQNGTLELQTGTTPVFLSGTGGGIIRLAARESLSREANRFLDSDDFQQNLPDALLRYVPTIAAADADPERLGFFSLLGAFPFLEQQWHSGRIPRETAVPALASLSRMLRDLCIIEQERNVPFIDPLQDTLGRSRALQQAFLEENAGISANIERGEALYDEISRLIAEAEQLARAHRRIEARAVAAMAEWRAQALAHTVNAAPLGPPEPVRPQPADETEEQGGQTGDNDTEEEQE